MKRLTIELTDLEWQAFADTVVDPRQWAKSAVKGKVDKCIKRVIAKEQARLLADPTVDTIPATVDGILESYFAQPHYESRGTLDTRQEASVMAAMNASLSGSSGE